MKPAFDSPLLEALYHSCEDAWSRGMPAKEVVAAVRGLAEWYGIAAADEPVNVPIVASELKTAIPTRPECRPMPTAAQKTLGTNRGVELMKLPIRLVRPEGPAGPKWLLDAEGAVVADLDAELFLADVERIILSVNAMRNLSLDQIRALGPSTARPGD